MANFGTQKKEFRMLMDDYPQGDLEEIFEYTLHPTETTQYLLNRFVYKAQYKEWLPKLDKMLVLKNQVS